MFESLFGTKGRCNAYIPPVQNSRRRQDSEPHAMTIDEFDQQQALVTVASMFGNVHRHFVEERRHDEVIEAIKSLREQ